MPPIRRYLRITRHSVLEVRIYLDNPSDAHRWLLHPRTPALPRVIAAVRPLVLPKLREENALSARKGKGRRKGWKDVVVEEGDFEVSIFLTETSTRHSILRKEKRAKGEEGRMGSTEGRMTGTRDEPVEVGEGLVRVESEGEDGMSLTGLPLAGGRDDGSNIHNGESAEEELFVSEEGSGAEDGAATGGGKRKRVDTDFGGDGEDGKKKMALDTSYDGFSIYGRILCLVVKRSGAAKGKEGAGQGQAMMEDWIASTQAVEGGMMED